MDSKLAADCVTLVVPSSADYDAWQEWVEDIVLRAYADCATRHQKTVEAWPK